AILAAIGTGIGMATGGALRAAPETPKLDGLSKKIRVGFIGVGDRGTALLKVLLSYPQAQVPVVCDIDPKALARAQDIVEKSRGKKPEGFGKDAHDYRNMLARDDFDAVIIATP